MNDLPRIKFSIDRGGTFTDVYAEVPGEPGVRVVKLLSENPDHYQDAPSEGIRRILEQVTGKPVSSGDLGGSRIEWIRMGTTVATNALLERKSARTALLITQGFSDLLQIGKQNRPRIFDLEIKQPAPLYEAVVEVDERVKLSRQDIPGNPNASVRGLSGEWLEVLRAPKMSQLRRDLKTLRDQGFESLAVVFLHAHTFPGHELLVGALAEEVGFSQVALSSQTLPRIRMVDRGQTCVVDAALTPLIKNYLKSFRSALGGKEPNLFFMQSDGGLTRADNFTGSRAILSGPAGGVVGVAKTTGDLFPGRPVIGFDMGGTSTDVSRFDGEYEWVQETEMAGVHLQVPQLDIRTVAAGGGSRLFFRNGLFAVGPESSGARPGPVCYRNNGFLSLTDANLLLGRLLPEFFPKVFGPNEDEALDADSVRESFAAITAKINAGLPGSRSMTPEQAALGFIEVANETMARPIREISVARGYDLKDHVLACFGGAGAQHATAIARMLEIPQVFIHRFAGILSAYGLGLADVVVEKQQPASEVLHAGSLAGLIARMDALAEQAVQELIAQGNYQIEVRRYLNLRVQGTDADLMVLQPADGDFAAEFRRIHQREFGFEIPDRDILVDDVRVRVTGQCAGVKKTPVAKKSRPTQPTSTVRCYFSGSWFETPVYRQEELGAEEQFTGPALIVNDTSTILIEPDCVAKISDYGDVVIDVPPVGHRDVGSAQDPVQLSLFGNRFMSIAEQMGRTLERTAISTNIKERRDFSCAIFDRNGDLVANAPHQPVHLGAMGEAVKAQIEIYKEAVGPGDVWLTNHPQAGGSHLPDITVVTPVLDQGRVLFFLANRGHHADIGGISPGSMPPFSTTLEEEGACISSFKLVQRGEFKEAEIAALLTKTVRLDNGRQIPGTRALADNLSDLKAQVAANQKGIELLHEMTRRFSIDTVAGYMGHLQDNAETSVRDALKKLCRQAATSSGVALDHLDDGSPIRLQLSIEPDGSATFDFSGSGPQVAGNWNAPKAVTASAILYCLRCLIKSDIPLNQGCLRPIRIVLEEGSLLAPTVGRAVAGGNVLTSQRVTDVVLQAFQAAAGSQGCMNNLTFGDESFAYYETIGGGAGAGPSWQGASGVHTHMTNTRITDPEILEQRYPVLLREFSIRKGSGGRGQYCGGEGLVREIEFLKPLVVTVLSERRVYPPYGMKGGQPGARGRNLLLGNDGSEIDLGGKNEIQAQPGDRIRILTPGGGGWGL